MTESEQAFDEWMKTPIPPITPSQDFVSQLIDEAQMSDFDHDEDAMYWEGRQGEPETMEEFFVEMRHSDQYWYEEWIRTRIEEERL